MFTIKLADKLFRINNKYSYVENLCQDYIVNEPCDTEISVTEEEISNENKDGGSWHAEYLESLAIYRKICYYFVEESIVLFHCSAVEMDGRGYLFTAPSGTGKSTHTRLWREHFGSRMTMINDDKPLLKITEDEVFVYGTPYGGKDNIQTNKSAKVDGIVILHQAPQNTIKRMTEREVYPILLNQTYRPEDISKTFRVMDLVKDLCRIPVYSMGCTISDEAVTLAYKTLIGGIR